jgi:UDP-N-acetyl-2-amino-2-deoxyglucuronate dehydrogenase
MPKNFALTGAAGYVAPRHLQAIHDTGNILVAALDRSDSVGILDRYFPEANFFTEFERFDRHIEKLRRAGEASRIDFVSICSPNYLHDAHIRFALRVGADAICEKPLVLNPWNIDALREMEEETGRRVWTILQLRLHPALLELKRQIEQAPAGKKHDVDLTYITSRGRWYAVSWKGDLQKSGGVATNIGVHFFDMLLWIFGVPVRQEVHLSTPEKAAGYMELANARVRWFLSLDQNDLPEVAVESKKRTYRCLTIDGKEVEFSDGFADLHTAVYRETLAGRGFGLDDALPSIQVVHDIRHAVLKPPRKGEGHPKLTGDAR